MRWEATSVRNGSAVWTELRSAASTRTRSSASQGSPSTTVMAAHGRRGNEGEQTAAAHRQFLTRPGCPSPRRVRERYARRTAVKSEVNQRPARSRKYEKPEGRR